MTTKPKAKAKVTPGKNLAALTVEAKENEEKADTSARISMRPSVQGALTLADYNKAFGELALDKLASGLMEQCDAVNGSDLKRAEWLLTVQAHTLDAIFNNLARRAIKAEYMDNLDHYLRLALKAQSQMPGDPRNAGGYQESARGVCTASERDNRAATNQQRHRGTHPGRRKSKGSKLNYQGMAMSYNEHPSIGFASRVSPALETVAEIDWAEVGRG